MECDAATRCRLPDDSEAGFWTAPDGCRIRTLRLRPEAGRRGAILFAGGRADYFENYLASLLQWRARGWDVTAFDWRGKGDIGSATCRGRGCHYVWITVVAGTFKKKIQYRYVF